MLVTTDAEHPVNTQQLQAIIIQDEAQTIRVMSPLAEQLLGWSQEAAAGKPCAEVLRCTNADGVSLCPTCGVAMALERQQLVPAAPRWITRADGTRLNVTANFWYLPPAGRIIEPRVMTALRPG